MHTMKDVARLAEVSTATVSAVLNSKPGVRPKLVKRVKDAMESLNYRPDYVARSLKVRRTNTIGVVVPEFTNPFYPEIMRGMEDVARRSGYSVIFCDSYEDRDLDHTHLSMLVSRRVDGVLMAPADPYDARDLLTRHRIPFVFFDRVPRGFPGPAVIIDNIEASRNATRYLIGLGHERNAVATWLPQLPAMVERVEGFRQALQEAHLPLRPEYIRWVDFSLESAYQCGLELMRLPEPPTAIFCCNNKMTLGVMRALGALHISCPETVSVLGFDDFDWAANISPRLTTVAQPTYEMGKQAMQLLMQKLDGEKDEQVTDKSQVIVLPTELRIRDSTAPPCRDPIRVASV